MLFTPLNNDINILFFSDQGSSVNVVSKVVPVLN